VGQRLILLRSGKKVELRSTAFPGARLPTGKRTRFACLLAAGHFFWFAGHFVIARSRQFQRPRHDLRGRFLWHRDQREKLLWHRGHNDIARNLCEFQPGLPGVSHHARQEQALSNHGAAISCLQRRHTTSKPTFWMAFLSSGHRRAVPTVHSCAGNFRARRMCSPTAPSRSRGIRRWLKFFDDAQAVREGSFRAGRPWPFFVSVKIPSPCRIHRPDGQHRNRNVAHSARPDRW